MELHNRKKHKLNFIQTFAKVFRVARVFWVVSMVIASVHIKSK